MSKNKFIMLVGLPASGKSTFREKFLDENPEYEVISSDDFIVQYAFERGKTYDEVFKEAAHLAQNYIYQRLNECVRNQDHIIWDQTNLSEKKRQRVLRQVPDDYEKAAVCFEINEEERQRRLTQRPGKTIPRAIDNAMRETYVRPSLEEGFDYIGVLEK